MVIFVRCRVDSLMFARSQERSLAVHRATSEALSLFLDADA